MELKIIVDNLKTVQANFKRMEKKFKAVDKELTQLHNHIRYMDVFLFQLTNNNQKEDVKNVNTDKSKIIRVS